GRLDLRQTPLAGPDLEKAPRRIAGPGSTANKGAQPRIRASRFVVEVISYRTSTASSVAARSPPSATPMGDLQMLSSRARSRWCRGGRSHARSGIDNQAGSGARVVGVERHRLLGESLRPPAGQDRRRGPVAGAIRNRFSFRFAGKPSSEKDVTDTA